MSENLWPEIKFEQIENALSVLKTQANELSKMSDNILTGDVTVTEAFNQYTDQMVLIYQFYVIAPKLGNFKFQILTVGQPYEPFPVDLVDKINEKSVVKIDKIEDLKKAVKEIFNTRKTIELLQNLYSQSKQI